MTGSTTDEASARTELVAAASRLARLGLSPGSSGNVSVRTGDRIVASPTGADLAHLDPGRLSVLALDGALLDGPRPTKEYPLHCAMYRRDADTRAVVHLHSANATAVSCLAPWRERSALPAISPYFVMRVGQTPLIAYADPGDADQAETMERLTFPFRAALLQNHGSLAAGSDPAAAAETAIELEEACRLWLLVAERAPHLLPDEAAARLSRQYGSPWTLDDLA